MRKALLYLSLITFAIALVLLCSPASAAAENNRRREYVLREAPDPSLPDQACRMIITFKDDVLITVIHIPESLQDNVNRLRQEKGFKLNK